VRHRGPFQAHFHLITKAIEKQLVQDHQVGGNELLALEAVNREVWRRIEVEACQPLSNQVEALHSAAIIVLVVADDELLGHTLDAPWIAPDRTRVASWHKLLASTVSSQATT